jgi:ribosomal protein S18 acetylase RimI-like enzyme
MFVPALTGHIRLVNSKRDLSQIADLIETCFAHQMDEDGKDYLRFIRRAIQDPNLQRWVRGSNEWISTPLFGYVWEEEGQVVGNLSLIPFQYHSEWRYLVANVATRPEYRGLGIARRLTQRAIEHVRRSGAAAVWLQVRDDNPIAQHLYLELGFQERARRSTWQVSNTLAPLLSLDHVQIAHRKRSEWSLQAQWLQQIYPAEVAWNLNFHLERFKPGILRELVRYLNNEHLEQWSVYAGQNLIGMAIWDAGAYNSETIWVAPNPDCEEEALTALLTLLRNAVHTHRPLLLNYPAGRGVAAFTKSGFCQNNTQIWMEIKYHSNP